MLIVACPKSASTTLMHTMSYMLGVGGIHKMVERRSVVPEYATLCSMHSDMTEYRKKRLCGLIGSDRWIYKLHIPPTEQNLKNFEEIDKPFVLLLRSPVGVYGAYKRQAKNTVDKNALDQIRLWEKRWYDFSINNKFVNVVTFEEFSMKPKCVTSVCTKTFGVEPVKNKLHVYNSTNYTGHGAAEVNALYKNIADARKKVLEEIDAYCVNA